MRYGRATALASADIVIPYGKVTGLVGPNGAGKSSLLLALYGSVEASGRVYLDQTDVSRMPAVARARLGIAFVPQGRQLFPLLTVRDNLRVMAELLKLDPRSIEEALDRFPILRVRERSLAGVLSGGEQQMLVVSRAMMGSPRVLLLDEVATGLAPLIVQSLAETFQRLAEGGLAVLYAAPEIGAVRDRIDRGYVIVRGVLVACEESGGEPLDTAYRSAMGLALVINNRLNTDNLGKEKTSPR